MTRVIRLLTTFTPTRRYAAVVALCAPVWLMAGLPNGPAIIAAVLVFLVLAVVIDAIRIPTSRALSVTRVSPEVAGLRDPTEGAYEVTSAARRPIRCLLDHLPPTAIDAPVPTTSFTVAAHATRTIPFPITVSARGIHSIGRAALTVFGPIGLAKRSFIYDLNDTIKVIPSFGGNRRYHLLSIQRRMRIAGSRALRLRGHGSAFSNLRDYATGDDPRHIDWKASARRHKLTSREFTVEQGQNVMIVIDAGRMMTQLSHDRARIEYALSSALTLTDVALAAGDRVGALVFNERIQSYVPPARGAAALTQIRDALVGTSATMAEPDYAAAFRILAERNKRRSLIVLFTDVIDMRSSRAVLANTARSAFRHLPLVVALRNDQLDAAACPTEEGTDLSAYTSVAAEELLSARADVLQHMRQAGVNVIDTSPSAMTVAVINRYLEIKDRALL